MSNSETTSGYYIDYNNGRSTFILNRTSNDKLSLFKTSKYSKSAGALAKISQIIANDSVFGGPITDEEWDSDIMKYTILRLNNTIVTDENDSVFRVLAFHTPEQRDLFLEENLELIKDYFML